MTTTLKGAATLAIALSLSTATDAQTPADPAEGQQSQQRQIPQQPRGQGDQAERPGLNDRQVEQQQQQTIRGRITSIRVGTSPRQTGQESSSEGPEQAGLQSPEAAGQRATIVVNTRSMAGDQPGGQGRTDQPPSDRESPRPGEGAIQEPPAGLDALAATGQRRQEDMLSYEFLATDQTLIRADDDANRPGRPNATDEPASGTQPGQQVPGARPGSEAPAAEDGQPAPQSYRGLYVGQYVEVTYRPMLNPRQDQPRTDEGRPRLDQDQPERPRPGQAGQDPTEPRPGQADQSGQADQAGQGRMIRAEALSIRVIPAPDLKEGLERLDTDGNTPNSPGPGSVPPIPRPGVNQPVPTP
ncbi:hypothetical protein AB1L88_26130 [Tautonia sp. JC769]|uniref:hypothetical protein n=1 Tax=Tautonia sp. JC769 TaxID=3232135 RepID=UPI003459867F